LIVPDIKMPGRRSKNGTSTTSRDTCPEMTKLVTCLKDWAGLGYAKVFERSKMSEYSPHRHQTRARPTGSPEAEAADSRMASNRTGLNFLSCNRYALKACKGRNSDDGCL
jgi:hypothetical protein